MPSENFVWQAENEPDWVESTLQPGQDAPAKSRRLAKCCAALVASTILILAVYVLLDRRINAAIEQTRAEILSTDVLLQEAIEARDLELFETLLAKGQSSWAEDQVQLLRESLLWGRSSLGIEPANPDNLVDDAPSVIIDPAMKRAEVTHTRPFVISTALSSTGTVLLQQTLLYQFNEPCWQLASLDEDDSFWGGWEYKTGRLVRFIYPERDAIIGRRLADDLDEMLFSLCASKTINCPLDFKLEIKFDRHVSSLLQFSHGYYAVLFPDGDGRYALLLPAPTLVGKPLDEAGYRALYRGYASWLGAIVIDSFAAAAVAGEQAMKEALLAQHDLALPPWPRPIFPVLNDESMAAAKELPHDILMLCRDPDWRRLLRYQKAQTSWVDEWPFSSEFASINTPNSAQADLWRLPDYSGALLSIQKPEAEQNDWQTFLWRDGGHQIWLEHEGPANFQELNLPISANSGEDILVGYHNLNSDKGRIIEPWCVDVQACLKGSCLPMSMDGIPIWSQDGRRSLLAEFAPREKPDLHLGDELGRSKHVLGRALPLSWVDNGRFAYLRHQINGVQASELSSIWQELVLSQATPGAESVPGAQVLVDAKRLQMSLRKENYGYQMGIIHAVPYGDGWLLAANEYVEEQQFSGYLFLFQPQIDTVTLLLELESEQIIPPLYANEDGKFLAISSVHGDDFLLRILNLESGEVRFRSDSYPYDWSADGQWLLFVEDRQLRVLAPALDYDWRIEHNLQNCEAAVWIDGRR